MLERQSGEQEIKALKDEIRSLHVGVQFLTVLSRKAIKIFVS